MNNLSLMTSLLFWNVTSGHDRTFSLTEPLSQSRSANGYLLSGCNGQTFHPLDLYTVLP